MQRERGRAVLLYVIDRRRRVGSITLRPGVVTFGYYWVDRPYNVYHWISPEGATIAFYFNICRDTKVSLNRNANVSLSRDTQDEPGRVEWTDLGVDLLVVPGERVTWLDVEEARALSPADRRLVANARRHLTERHSRIARALGAQTRVLLGALKVAGLKRRAHRDARRSNE